jgi:hypothetical protein
MPMFIISARDRIVFVLLAVCLLVIVYAAVARMAHHGYAESAATDERDRDALVESARHKQPPSSPQEIQAFLTASRRLPREEFEWVSPGSVNPLGSLVGRSGKLQAFAWEPTHSAVMYAGGGLGSGDEGPITSAGVFKTVDSGNTWAAINEGLLDTTVNVLWIDQSNPDIVLAGTEYGGLFRTTNAGLSWMQVSPDAPTSAVVSFAGGVEF